MLSLNTFRDLLLLSLLARLLAFTTERRAVVSLVPCAERSSIDLDDSGFGESICSDKFVVRRVESNNNDTSFARDTFAAPREVTGVETKSTEFPVATSSANKMDSLVTNTGVCRLATFLESSTHFELENVSQDRIHILIDLSIPLLPVECAFCTGCSSLVARVSRNTHGFGTDLGL